jgi:hypothetical protein
MPEYYQIAQYSKPDKSKTGEKKGDIYSESGRLVKQYMNTDSMPPNTPEWNVMTIFLMKNPQAPDAARHVIGSMIQTDRSGVLVAAALGWGYEFVGAALEQDAAQRKMDEHNNRVGRELYQKQREQLGRRPKPDEMALYALKNAILSKPPLAILSTSDPRAKVRGLNGSF